MATAAFETVRPGGVQCDENQGQPWTSTVPTLQLLHDLGVDPCSDRVRRAVALVRDHCRWEHDGQPFFSGEVEPLRMACGTARWRTQGQASEVLTHIGLLCWLDAHTGARPAQ